MAFRWRVRADELSDFLKYEKEKSFKKPIQGEHFLYLRNICEKTLIWATPYLDNITKSMERRVLLGR